jgi:hypothetical protein
MTPPSASITLLTYNQEQFVQEALLSLLNQDIDDLEIVVSDDCSSDATWEKIQVVVNGYQGSKKIILSRNSSNMGIVDNYAAAARQSSGDLIFMAAGDDISLPDRCSKSIQFWFNADQKFDLVAADAFDMTYDGKILGTKESSHLEDWTIQKWFESRPFFFGASHMVTRRLLSLAPLNNQMPYEDQCLVFRAILMGGAARLPIPLVIHRRGGVTQALGFKFGHRRVEIAHNMAREILELQQFLGDAFLLGKHFAIEGLIAKKLDLCKSVLALFECKRSLSALWTFWRSANVTMDIKLRYSRYYIFYPVLAIAHGIRDSLRMLRNRVNPHKKKL